MVYIGGGGFGDEDNKMMATWRVMMGYKNGCGSTIYTIRYYPITFELEFWCYEKSQV